MNPFASVCDQLRANLERLQLRSPELPLSSVLLSRLIVILGRGMADMLEHQIRPFGLSEAEFRVLTALFSQPDGLANPTNLCTQTSQRPANMSRISDALVDRDLITRVPSVHDRRMMVLRITTRGEALVRQLLPTLYEPLRGMFAGFSEPQKQQLIAQLCELAEKLEDPAMHEGPERTG
ncbi:MAG: MarR family transcriptional regulator [Pseudomonadota bacterium]|nr:MarR family transcriptional regulator [Pseudomonadota bacterium]